LHPTAELLFAIFRKALDQRILAAHNLSKIEADFLCPDSPWLGMTGQMHDFGGNTAEL